MFKVFGVLKKQNGDVTYIIISYLTRVSSWVINFFLRKKPEYTIYFDILFYVKKSKV